jgi:two-component system response regulator NreC
MQSAAHSRVAPGRLRVLLIDDHPVVIAGLKSFLREDPEVEPVGAASSIEEAKERAARLKPDVFLLVLSSSASPPLEATLALREAFPEVAVVILTLTDTVASAAALSKVGVSAMLDKNSGRHAVLSALYALRGDDQTGPRRLVPNRDLGSSPPPPSSGTSSLSPREIQVLTLIAEGYTNKQIADQLGISVRTVETHRERLMRKLDVQGTAALTKAAITLGLVRAG